MNPKKGLFHGNFLTPNLGFLEKTYGISTILEEISCPYYVWTDVGPIVELENTTLSKELKEKFNTEGAIIFLYEIMSSKFFELDSIQQFVKKNDLTNITVNVCEYNAKLLQPSYPEFKIQTFDIFLRSLKHSSAFFDIDNKIIKHFWSGNWRYAVHRHLIVAYLTQYNGNYSWHFSCPIETLKKNSWIDIEQLSESTYNKLYNGINLLENKSFSIDTMIPPIPVNDCNEFYLPGSFSKTKNLVDSYGECFCAIVTETIYESDLGYISEKTTCAISARLPFIIVGGPNSLDYFKKLGFKTFDRWWDESYDQELNHSTRLLKIFNLIDKIGNTPIDELKQIYTEMIDILEHNINVLKNLSANRMIM